MALPIDTITPTERLKGVLLDPVPRIGEGMIHPAIFRMPGANGVDHPNNMASAMATVQDFSPSGSQPGLLGGTIRVRNARSRIGAAAGSTLFTAIDGPRHYVERAGDADVTFAVKAIKDGAKESIKILENGYSADEEEAYFNDARNSHHQKFERYCIEFFTRIAADGASVDGLSSVGWREVDWDASYTKLGNGTTTFVDNFRTVAEAAEKAAYGRPSNVCYGGRDFLAKLARDPSFRDLLITSDGTGTSVIKGDSGVIPESLVFERFRQHFGMELKIARHISITGVRDRTSDAVTEGELTYEWPSDRIWIGHEGPVRLTRGVNPRVVEANGAFTMITNGLMQTGVMDVGEPIADTRVFGVNSFIDLLALHPERGTIIYDLI